MLGSSHVYLRKAQTPATLENCVFAVHPVLICRLLPVLVEGVERGSSGVTCRSRKVRVLSKLLAVT